MKSPIPPPQYRIAAALLVVGFLATLSIPVLPAGRLVVIWPFAGPLLWLVATLVLTAQLGLSRAPGGRGGRAVAIVLLAVPWTALGVSYLINILRQNLPLDIAHLTLGPMAAVLAMAAGGLIGVFRSQRRVLG